RQGFSALPAALPLRPELDDLLNKTVRSPTPLPRPPSGLIDMPAFVQMVMQERGAMPPFASLEVTHPGPIGADLLQKLALDAKLTVPNPASDLIGPNFDVGNGWSVSVSSPAQVGTTLELQRDNGTWKSNGGSIQGELVAIQLARGPSPTLSLADSRFLLIDLARLALFVSLRAPDSPGADTRLFSIGVQADGLGIEVKALGLDLLGGGDGF